MRVLVTGGAGFVGSHLVDHLIRAGHEVLVLDNLSTGRADYINPEARFRQIDVRSPIAAELAAFRPEVAAHLAAQVAVPRSVTDPLDDLSINGNGTINLVEAAARAGVRKVVFISSAAVYGNPATMPITEETETNPLSPYGLSKLTAERYVRLLGDLRGVAWTIIRPANIYGPRQTTEGEGAVVPAFLTRLLRGVDPVVHGDGQQIRDFVFVGDMAAAIASALTRADGLTLNVSTGQAITINGLWRLLAERVGWVRSPVYGPPREGDIAESVMANGRAVTALEWSPAIPLEQGLDETVSWSTAT